MVNYFRHARALPVPVKMLLAANALSSFGGGLVLPFLWIYLRDVRGLPLWVPATTMAVQAATAAAAGLGWGYLVDRVGQRNLAAAVMIVAAIGTAGYGFVTNPVAALVMAVVYGIGIAGVGTVIRTMYGAITAPGSRETVFSIDFALFNAMVGLGVVAGGALSTLPWGTRADRFQWLFVLDGVTFIVAAIATLIVLPSTVATEAEEAQAPSDNPGYRAILRDRNLFAILAILLLSSLVCYGQFRSGLSGYLVQRGIAGSGGLSLIFALNVVISILAQSMLSKTADRIGRGRLVTVCGTAFALTWTVLLLAGLTTGLLALSLAAGAVVVLSIAEALLTPTLAGLLNELVSDGLRGRANALFSVMLSTGAVMGPVLAGGLLGLRQGLVFAVSLALLSVAAAVLGGVLGRGLPTTDAATPAKAVVANTRDEVTIEELA